MKEIKGYPPNIDLIEKKFPGVKKTKGILITYGDLYNPDGVKLSTDEWIHERTHAEQQKKIGLDKYWEMYVNDENFRLEQELLAYRNQYKYVVENYSGVLQKKILEVISKTLSSPLYGSLISERKAKKLIYEK